MPRKHSFKFLDDTLNQKLIALLDRKAKGKYSVSQAGFIRYSHDDEDLIGNEVICAVRANVFSSWQIVSCPRRWLESYRHYMQEHRVPFSEEIRDGELRFLISRKFRPHSWSLECPRRAVAVG